MHRWWSVNLLEKQLKPVKEVVRFKFQVTELLTQALQVLRNYLFVKCQQLESRYYSLSCTGMIFLQNETTYAVYSEIYFLLEKKL